MWVKVTGIDGDICHIVYYKGNLTGSPGHRILSSWDGRAFYVKSGAGHTLERAMVNLLYDPTP